MSKFLLTKTFCITNIIYSNILSLVFLFARVIFYGYIITSLILLLILVVFSDIDDRFLHENLMTRNSAVGWRVSMRILAGIDT